MTLETLFIFLLVVLIAYVIKGATGFGENMLMIPLLLLFYDIKFVLPIILILVLFADIYLIYKFHKAIDKKLLRIFAISSIGGIIIGSWLLNILSGETIKVIFAVFVIIFSLKNLFAKSNSDEKKSIDIVPASAAGFGGGLLSGFIGVGGPPLVMYVDHLNLKKAVFRATLVATFFVFDIQRLITYAYSGLVATDTIKYSIYLIPSMIVGSFVGMKLHSRINEVHFKKVVSVILLFAGVMLLVQSI